MHTQRASPRRDGQYTIGHVQTLVRGGLFLPSDVKVTETEARVTSAGLRMKPHFETKKRKAGSVWVEALVAGGVPSALAPRHPQRGESSSHPAHAPASPFQRRTSSFHGFT